MCLKTTTKQIKIAGKMIAILAGSAGLYIIVASLWSLWQIFHGNESFSVFLIVFATLMVVLGGYCISVAVRAWSNISANTVRGICLITVIFLCSILMAILQGFKINTFEFQEFTWAMLTLPLVMITGGIFYWFCSKGLIRWLALPETPNLDQRRKVTKHFFGFLAVFSWGAFCQVIMALTSKNKGDTFSAPEKWWVGVVLFGSLLLALLFYKVAVRIILCKEK